MTTKKTGGAKKGPPFQQWKPSIQESGQPRVVNIRFLPYADQNEQPFQEVQYYDSKKVSPTRIVAPSQFGLPDPFAVLVTELRKKRNDTQAWNTLKELLPKPRYFAPILVREEAEKGVQIWEMSPTNYKDIVAQMVSDDYREEDLTDPFKGRDFQVTISNSGKIFKAPNGTDYPVKDIKIMPRAKTSKLAADQKAVDDLLKTIPDLQEIFRKQVKSEEEMQELLSSYIEGLGGGSKTSSASPARGNDSDVDDALSASIEDQFADL